MKWNRERINIMVGLAGVSPFETEVARAWAKRLEWPMIMVAFWIPLQWYLEEVNMISAHVVLIGDWFVWLAFLLESIILLSLVHDKRQYLLNNWMNVAIILTGVFIIWGYAPVLSVLRSLRVLLVLGLLLRISRTLTKILKQNQLGNLLAFTLFIVVVSGVMISGFDPAIHDPWEGIWWALVSITTVGYGDVVPVSGPGKFFASLLIVLGIVVFSVLTATVSAYLIRRSEEERGEEIHDLLKDVQRRLERIENKLKKIEQESEQ
jgi:voltage-gated potassium channel